MPLRAILVWLGAQSAAIALAALRIPLWAQAPQATEFFAPTILMAVQILAATLLLPSLLTTWRGAVLTAATAWPFIILAGFLAAAPMREAALAGIYLTGWIIALRAACFPLTAAQQRLRLSALTCAWSAAGPILSFIGREYAAAGFEPINAKHSWAGIASGPFSNGIALMTTAFRWEIRRWLPLLIPIIAVWGVAGCGKVWKLIDGSPRQHPR